MNEIDAEASNPGVARVSGQSEADFRLPLFHRYTAKSPQTLENTGLFVFSCRMSDCACPAFFRHFDHRTLPIAQAETHPLNRIVVHQAHGRSNPLRRGLFYFPTKNNESEVTSMPPIIRPMTPAEQKYTYRQSQQLTMQCGAVGYLRADFGRSGDEFHTTWFDLNSTRNTPEFKSSFDDLINTLRADGGPFDSRNAMRQYCGAQPGSAFPGNCCTEYGFRADIGEHACLIRCNPSPNDYNVYVFPYVAQWLDRHLEQAEQGIRFIDSRYNEQFRLEDGGKVTITHPDGEQNDHICRFIDETHLEVGRNLYHICELAERLERNGSTIVPVGQVPPTRQQTMDEPRMGVM
ncbi:hypothetical protein LJC34_00340 [Oscillospiraceae bacterium OttesenSCG-928-G22]|nr:hypothetical protein [Oscillospiraceae bacterium OttesenSCG-928-G22]